VTVVYFGGFNLSGFGIFCFSASNFASNASLMAIACYRLSFHCLNFCMRVFMPIDNRAKTLNPTNAQIEPMQDQPMFSFISKSGTIPVKRTKW
jgi:hypothetical protein